MLCHRPLVAAWSGEGPRARRVGVGHCFECGKGLRRHDKQRFLRSEIAYCFREVRAVDIGNESEGHVALAIVPEGLIGHNRSEIGAANADVDYITNALTGMTFPRAAPHAVREAGHLVEHSMYLRDHVLSIDHK